MPHYRRVHVPGGTFFFTVVTANRQRILCKPQSLSILRKAFDDCRSRWPFVIDAIVLLPDHLHTIWSLPRGDTDYSRRWAFIKKEFTKQWLTTGGAEQPQTQSQIRHRRRGVWQRRFWEHTVRDDNDYVRHIEYIHYNPVKHNLAKCPHSWSFSSFNRYVRLKRYSEGWACACNGHMPIVPDFSDLLNTGE